MYTCAVVRGSFGTAKHGLSPERGVSRLRKLLSTRLVPVWAHTYNDGTPVML